MEKRRIGAERENPHQKRREQVEGQGRPPADRRADARQHHDQRKRGNQRQRQRLVCPSDREQPDGADLQNPRSVHDRNRRANQQHNR